MNRKTKPNLKLYEIVQQFERRDPAVYPALWDDKTYHRLIDYYCNQGSLDRAIEVANTALAQLRAGLDANGRTKLDAYIAAAQAVIQAGVF